MSKILRIVGSKKANALGILAFTYNTTRHKMLTSLLSRRTNLVNEWINERTGPLQTRAALAGQWLCRGWQQFALERKFCWRDVSHTAKRLLGYDGLFLVQMFENVLMMFVQLLRWPTSVLRKPYGGIEVHTADRWPFNQSMYAQGNVNYKEFFLHKQMGSPKKLSKKINDLNWPKS